MQCCFLIIKREIGIANSQLITDTVQERVTFRHLLLTPDSKLIFLLLDQPSMHGVSSPFKSFWVSLLKETFCVEKSPPWATGCFLTEADMSLSGSPRDCLLVAMFKLRC